VEAAWHPDVLSYQAQRDAYPRNVSNSHLAHPQIPHSGLIGVFADHLKGFKNLHHVSYAFEPRNIPARYDQINYGHMPNLSYEPYRLTDYSGMGAHIGLEVMKNSLVALKTYARTMELAVNMDEHHALLTGLSEDVVAKACNKVEHLRLTEAHGPRYNTHGTHLDEPRIRITNSTFPALRSLSIDRQFMGTFYDSRPYSLCSGSEIPTTQEVPQLKQLTILRARTREFVDNSFRAAIR
jgi:hypothetical protein